MKVRVLGCGGSFGSPLAWGRNGNIDINNPHNFRTRSSVLISNNNQNILIDTSPDLIDQLYRAECTKIDAVLFTHEHSWIVCSFIHSFNKVSALGHLSECQG